MPQASQNIFWLSLSRVAALAMLFVAYTQLFRYLGPFGSGQQQFVLSYVTIFGVIVDFGIQQYIIKKISEEREKARQYFDNFLATETVLAFLIYGLLLGLAILSGYEKVVLYAIAVFGLGMVINALSYPFLSVMTAVYDLKKVALINFISSLVNVIIITLAIIFHRYIVFLVSNQVIFGVIALFMYWRYVAKHLPGLNPFKSYARADPVFVKGILKAAVPFALLVGFSTIYNRIDVVLIARMLGYAQTGLYAAAYKFYDLVAFFPSVVSLSLYPLLTSLMARGSILEVRAALEKYQRFMIAIALPMATGAAMLSGPIIALVAGREFAPSAPVLAILVWAPAALFIYIVANALVISQLTKFAVVVTAVNVLVNTSGNIFLLPLWGIKAAAIMTVVSETLQGALYLYLVRKKITRFNFFSYFPLPILASLGMAALLWPVRHYSLLLSVPLGGAAYFLLLLIFGYFKKSDLEFAKNFFKEKAVI